MAHSLATISILHFPFSILFFFFFLFRYIEFAEGYDEMAKNMMGAKDRLQQILLSKDKKATLLEMASGSQIDRSLLALLDQNISAANAAEEVGCRYAFSFIVHPFNFITFWSLLLTVIIIFLLWFNIHHYDHIMLWDVFVLMCHSMW